MRYIIPILRIIVVLLLQVLLFNNLHFLGICYPYAYILLLICLPIVPRWAEMLIGFAVGMVMDICCSSLGMHTAACVLISWLRPILLARMVQDYERVAQEVLPASIGVAQFVRLAVILCLIHHAMVFMMDAWSLSQIGWVILKWIVSSIMTLVVILGYGFLHRT